MRLRLAFIIFALACASNVPPYTSHVEQREPNSFVVSLDSTGNMSSDDMRRALLTEASRATIDRGGLYMRIDDISTESHLNMESSVSADPNAQPTTEPHQGSATGTYKSDVSLSKRRSGAVRFTIFKERPE